MCCSCNDKFVEWKTDHQFMVARLLESGNRFDKAPEGFCPVVLNVVVVDDEDSCD